MKKKDAHAAARAAYYEQAGALSAQECAIRDAFRKLGPSTDQKIAIQLGMPLKTVYPKISDLIVCGVLVVHGQHFDPRTSRVMRVVKSVTASVAKKKKRK